MSIYTDTVTIAAGQIGRVAVAGTGFAITQSNLPDFRVAVDGESFQKYRQGWEYNPPDQFEVLQIENPNTVALIVDVVIWSGRFVDRSFITNLPQSFLPVTLEDLSGRSYWGSGSVNALVGANPRLQIGSLLSEGVVSIIRTLWLRTTIAADVQIKLLDTAVDSIGATFQGNVWSTVTGVGAALNQGATSVYTSTTGQTPGLGARRLQMRIPADATYRVPLAGPIVIHGSNHIEVLAGMLGAANTLEMAFDCLELPSG